MDLRHSKLKYLHAEYNEATGALVREYVWLGWSPIAVIEGGFVSFVRSDHIGRPVFATNAAGTKVWTASYLPFGGVRTTTGTPPTARFPGQWFQSESGLHQNWMRDYDPTTGRYLQADPLGLVAGASVYGYANQSPMMYMDPNGENPVLIAIGVGIALNVVVGYLSDYWLGDGCCTLDELGRDAAIGAMLGPLGLYGNAGRLGVGLGGLGDDGLRAAARYGPGPSIQAAADAARAAGLNSRQVGNAAHDALTAWVNAFKPGWQAGRRVVTPSGKVILPDIITRLGRYIDLKPNTLTGRLAGEAKAAYYYALTGIRTRIIYYN